MDIKRLLNQDIINFDIIKKSLNKRTDLIKEQVQHPSVEWFLRIQSIEDSVVLPYYLGDLEVIRKLICVCDPTFIPIFPGDMVKVEGSFGRVDQIKSHVFINHVLDGLADADNLMTSSPNLLFKLYNVNSIQIVAEKNDEASDFFSSLESLDVDLEGSAIKSHVISLINEELKMSPGYKKISTMETIMEDLDNVVLKEIATYGQIRRSVGEYLKSRDLLKLVRLIYYLAKETR